MAPFSLPARGRVLIGSAIASALVFVGMAPTASAFDPVRLLTVSTAEYDFTLDLVDGDHFFNRDQGSRLEATVDNLTGSPLHLGLGADLAVKGVEQRLWLPDAFGADEVFELFAPVVDPHSQHFAQIPDWPGMTFSFYVIDPDGIEQPQLLGTYTATGQHVPVAIDLDTDPQSIEIGRTATFSGTEAFPGVTATVSATGLTPGDNLQLWLAEGADYWSFLASGAQLPASAVYVGNGVVAVDGSLSAPFVVPSDLAFGYYQLLVGNPVGRNWPAGTLEPIQIAPAPQSGSTATAAGENVTVSVPLGPTGVTFDFATVLSEGTTTATSSATGPLVTGFTMATDPRVYYHLETTAVFEGSVEVCISFDPATLTGGQPNLYHQVITRNPEGAIVSSSWQNITTTRGVGVVCGLTDSFSPFALGYPTGVQLTDKDQCKKGGWATSTLPVFANQGACVSYFAKNKG